MKFDLSPVFNATSFSSCSINYYCYGNYSPSANGHVLCLISVDPVTSNASTIYNNGNGWYNVSTWSCTSCWFGWNLYPELNNIFNSRVTPGWTAFKIASYTNNATYNFFGYNNAIYRPYLTLTYLAPLPLIPAPVTTINSAIACPGDTIILHVTATNCPAITAINLELDYDAAVMSFINLNPNGDTSNFYNMNPSLYSPTPGGSLLIVQSNATPLLKKVRAGWYTLTPVALSSVNNIAHLFDLSFRYYSGNTSIVFNNSAEYGGDCEYADPNGNPYIDTPTVNYYINGTVTQGIAPVQPGVISGYIHPVIGDTTVYTVTNVAGVTYMWSAPSGWHGTSSSSSITYIVGSGTGAITVNDSNGCGTGMARIFDVYPIEGYTIKGTLTYDNIVSTPLDSAWMFLKLNGVKLDSVQTGINGHYQFNVTNNGDYNITATTHKAWGAVNSSDAVKVKRHYIGTELLTSSIRLHAADVNMSLGINSTDAMKITRRFVGSDTSFNRGDWVFEKPLGGDTINVSYINDSLIVNGNNVVQNFKGLCVGDVNGSNFPLTGAKLNSKVKINFSSNDIIKLNTGEYFELPVMVANDINVGAISLIINYPKNLIRVENCETCNNLLNKLYYKITSNQIRIGWFKNNDSVKLNKGETLFKLKIQTLSNFKSGDVIKFTIANDPLCEFADEKGNSIDNVVLKTYTIEHSTEQNIDNTNLASNIDFHGNILQLV